ncbi:Isochorismatase hydrolase [Hymenopellis radicata]|nr:Isochorismatase hydrolase [Hymenopellis radicata]
MSLKLSSRSALIVVDVQNGLLPLPRLHPTAQPISYRILPRTVFSHGSFSRTELRHPEHLLRHRGISGSLATCDSRPPRLPPRFSAQPQTFPDGYAVMPEAAPAGDEIIFVKNVNSSFIGTGLLVADSNRLEAHLRAAEIGTLVILGLTTSHCVSTTTRMAGNLGFEVFLPRNGTAMFECPAAPGITSTLTLRRCTKSPCPSFTTNSPRSSPRRRSLTA